MIKQYFKQALNLLRQQKLFSCIYIAGTALTIATATVFAISYYIRIAPTYPESRRNTTGYLSTLCCYGKVEHWQSVWGFNHNFTRDFVSKLKTPQMVSTIFKGTFNEENFLAGNDGVCDIKVSKASVDTTFFKIFDYEFIHGAPFSSIEFTDGINKAVITDRLASRLYGTDDVMGKTVKLNYTDYEICGVVRSGSSLNKRSYGDIFVPYTTVAIVDEDDYDDEGGYIGAFEYIIVSDNLDEVHDELQQMVNKHNAISTTDSLVIYNQPQTHAVSEFFSAQTTDNITWGEIIRKNCLILLVLLLVPALNLSGMISGRMEMRTAELGVRKSFGATRSQLLMQILWENLFLTIAGGIIGLLLVWIVMYLNQGQIFTLLYNTGFGTPDENNITREMLFNPAIFLIDFFICLVLNMLSALIPAWANLRHPIVQSLKTR